MNATFTYLSEVFFDELDGLGILHHTRYLLHLERAQQKFFQELLGVPDFNAGRDEDIYVVVRGIEANFKEPFHTPGPLAVDYQIERIRSGGVTMRFTIRCPENNTVYCDGSRTVCKISAETSRPKPWTDQFRQAMEAFQTQGTDTVYRNSFD